MRIGKISDTHIPQDAEIIPSYVIEIFQDDDLILHAADIYISSVLDELEAMAPVLAAAGDDEYAEVRQDRRVKEKHILHFESVTILC